MTPTDAMVALAILGNAGAWAKVFVDGRKYRNNGKGCGAPEIMVEHSAKLATHSAEIGSLKVDLISMKIDNHEEHLRMFNKLDSIIFHQGKDAKEI
jgi:hypothetical protein